MLILAGLAYANVIHPSLVPRRFAEVASGKVYRSGRLTPGALARVVERHGIKTVIDFGADPEGTDPDRREAATAAALGIDRVVFRLEGDARGDPNAYARALAIMTDPARLPVLVHCSAGTERTGCMVILYRHLVEGVSIDDAYAESLRMGHDADNPHVRLMAEEFKDDVRRSWRSGEPIEGWLPRVK